MPLRRGSGARPSRTRTGSRARSEPEPRSSRKPTSSACRSSPPGSRPASGKTISVTGATGATASATPPSTALTATIGRLPECEVVLKDRGASRRHAQISLQDGAATLTDLGSTNGTQVNGHTVQRVQLDDGDRITIGTTVLVFRRA